MPAQVGVGNISGAQHAFKSRPQHDAVSAETVNGKSTYSPAHRARAVIENANLGEAAPANLHGKVTSGLARGIDISSLLVLQSDEPSDTDIPEDDSAAIPDGEGDTAETPASETEVPAPAQSEPVASTESEAETVGIPPIESQQIDDQLVDLLIESLDKDAA